MKLNPKYLLPLLSLCLLAGLGITVASYRPLRTDHLMYPQPLGRQLLTDSSETYSVGYALPALRKLELHFGAALPDTVFLVPGSGKDYLEILHTNPRMEPPLQFRCSPLQEGRAILNPYNPETEVNMKVGFSVRLHFKSLDALEIQVLDAPGFVPPFPVIGERPLRQKNFWFSYPKFAYPELEVHVGRLWIEENGSATALLAANSPGRPYDISRKARFSGSAFSVRAKDITKFVALEGLRTERVALTANEYAVVHVGTPRVLSVSHTALGYFIAGSGGLHKGEVFYEGSPIIREKYLAGRPTLQLVRLED